MTTTEITILSILFNKFRFRVPANEDSLTYDFISSGFVDSLGIIRFVAELEREFGVKVPMEIVASPEFRTVAGVAKLIGTLYPTSR